MGAANPFNDVGARKLRAPSTIIVDEGAVRAFYHRPKAGLDGSVLRLAQGIKTLSLWDRGAALSNAHANAQGKVIEPKLRHQSTPRNARECSYLQFTVTPAGKPAK
jgi:hypothetical protein